MAHVVAKIHKDASGFGLTPEAILMPEGRAAARTIHIRVACIAIRGHSDIRAQIAMGGGGHVWVCMSGSVALLQPGCVLMSVAPATSEGHVTAWGLGCHLEHVGVQRPHYL